MTKTVSLGEICTILSGFAFDSELFNDSVGMPLIRIRDVGKDRTDTFYSGPYSERYVIQAGDMLVGMDGDFRMAEWRSIPALLNQRVCKLEPIRSRIDPKFLLHFLPKQLKQIEDATPFATVKHLSVKTIQAILIPLPSLEEQRRIAALLDRADALRQKDRQLLIHYDQLAQSLFLDLFGDPVRNEKGWSVNALENIADTVSGVTKNTKQVGVDMVTAPYMRVANVQDGELDLMEIKTVSVSKKDYVKYQLQTGDILLTEGGDPDKLGRGAVWQGEIPNCIHQNHIFRVRPDTNTIHSTYLSTLIGSQYGKNYFLKAAKQTTGIASINMTQLKRFSVQIPPLTLQNHFAGLIERIGQQKALVRQQLAASEALFGRLVQESFESV